MNRGRQTVSKTRGATPAPTPRSTTMNSQASSDDNGLGLVVAERFIAQTEKKSKDARKKHLEVIRKGITADLDYAAEECRTITGVGIQQLCNEFTMSYAAIDDKIRMLLTKIQDEQILLTTLGKKYRSKMETALKESGDSTVNGFAKMHTASTEAQQIMKELL
ncbi:hypothetical protein C8J56DRAFT_919354 [Mycena floridula]|nr:hypothetical protein C8J56DRAFT_919354 [Mycena floridula]